ncbi:MAG: hypothetical protein COA97_11790 [Flavobacteriales bacterium]|nr:MAG: hypothetical protein COA97_11790 [Flavobacteriales bacterium]
MKLSKLALLAFSVIIITGTIHAQKQGVCYTDEYFNERAEKDPSLLQKRKNLENYIANFKQTYDPSTQKATIIIPVVVHNITWVDNNGFLKGYVSNADVDAQLLTMNEDLNRLNADAVDTRALFVPYAAVTDVEFRLAHIDPNGNCTDGIVRKESPLSFNTVLDDAVKSVSYWDSKKYFNIWVIDEIQDNGNGSYVAGYAQFPGSGINNTYGIVCVDQNFGAGSRTMTHEVGHCFNLYHTFQSGCGSNCSNSSDYCCDTPPVATSSFGCPVTNNTCSNDANGPDPYGTNVLDQIENYMSYNSSCQNMFSLDQKIRMLAVLTSTSTSTGLAQLSTASNLTATGTANPYSPVVCTPIAEFNYDKEFICEGATVNFTDNSYNAVPTAWNWIFTGGTPATSGVSNPAITYNTVGVYSVTHQPSTSAGTGSITKTSIVTVSSLTADYVGPIIDSFEIQTKFDNEWWVNSMGGQTWAYNTTAAYTGTGSVRILNRLTGTDGELDELISPSYDISTSTTKTMTFKYAFAKKSSADTDKMYIYYSIDCGNTWVLKLPLTATTLPTAPNQSSAFVPGVNDWVQKSINLSTIGTETNVRFKFSFTSGGGNDIYIDDINIGDYQVGLENFSNIGSFSVYPNPTNSSAQISFNLTKDVKNLSIKVRNAIGQEVTSVIEGQSFNSGKYTLKIDEQRKLSPGIYFIEFNADDNVKVQKLIIQ